MMKKNILVLVVSLTLSHFVSGQSMPVDFTDNADVFTAFDGSGFSANTDPEDGSNQVGQFFNDGAVAWQGFYLDLNQPVNFDSDKIITLSFYQFDPNAHNIVVKFENGDNDDVEVVVNTSGAGWKNDLEFDFSNATLSGTVNTTNATGNYSRLVIFVDGGLTVPGTYLIDDINDGSEPTDPNEIDVVYDLLVWADEFDGPNGSIDSNNWFHQTQLPAGGSWFNGEVQHYTNREQNSSVEDGFLNITAIKENFTDQGETKEYTSARLNSKFAFTYGRVDVRAKLPFGNGTWPAIWTLGKNINEAGAYWETQGFGEVGWPACGEIDIMEHGLHGVNEVSVALHTPSSSGNTVNTAVMPLPDVANEFHVYSMNWSPNQITFLIDGVGFYTYNPAIKDDATWPFDKDQYLILNIAMGGFAGTIDPSFSQSSMVIDYVRVYQNAELSTEEYQRPELRVFPNPVNDILTINTSYQIDKVEVHNTLGQLVHSKRPSANEVQVSELAKGVYLLSVYSNGNRDTLRFVKN